MNMLVKNSLIAKNIADSTNLAYGGAFYAYYSTFSFQNCTFANNSVISDTGNAAGGAIYVANTHISLSIDNSIFWNNVAVSRYGSGSAEGNDFAIIPNRPYTIIINNCLYSKQPKYGVSSVYDPNNLLSPNLSCTFDSEPYFVDANAGNFRLQHTNIGYNFDSPCIDRGNNTLLSGNITQDLDGNPRFVNGDGMGAATIDMGCYEKQN